MSEDFSFKPDELPDDRSLVIVDDNVIFLERLGAALAQRGFETRTASSVAAGIACIQDAAPAFAVVDLRLQDGSGLEVLEVLHALRPDARAIMLTAYGNFPTVVSAIKLGAIDFLIKPVDTDEMIDALLAPRNAHAPPPGHARRPEVVRWEHIQTIFAEHHGNISETARRLLMHRRTLQRVLAKGPPPNEPIGGQR